MRCIWALDAIREGAPTTVVRSDAGTGDCRVTFVYTSVLAFRPARRAATCTRCILIMHEDA